MKKQTLLTIYEENINPYRACNNKPKLQHTVIKYLIKN